MQTKNTIQFQQHFDPLLDLLSPQQCPSCRPFCFNRGLCAGCWQGLVLARVLHNGLQPLLSGADFFIERCDRRRVLQYDMAVFHDY